MWSFLCGFEVKFARVSDIECCNCQCVEFEDSCVLGKWSDGVHVDGQGKVCVFGFGWVMVGCFICLLTVWSCKNWWCTLFLLNFENYLFISMSGIYKLDLADALFIKSNWWVELDEAIWVCMLRNIILLDLAKQLKDHWEASERRSVLLILLMKPSLRIPTPLHEDFCYLWMKYERV